MKAIKDNLKQIKKYIGPDVGVAAVVKSNAYGHGIVAVAKAAVEAGVEFLCVDNVQEAKQICNLPKSYKLKANVLILGGVESEDLPWVIKNNVRLALFNSSQSITFERSSQRCGKKAKVHIKVDTGMHRLGIEAAEAVKVITKINNNCKNIAIEGIWSHFADSGSQENKKYTLAQIKKFKGVVDGVEKEGIKIKYKHLCNSSGLIFLPEACFNLVRAGILLYGIFPSQDLKKQFQKKLNLKPAMSFKTKIISLRKIKKGESIGYGLAYRLKKNSKIAVLAVGYKDGYGRDLSSRGEVIIKNKKCPVVGRICMRMMMVDVSQLKDVKLGEEVVLLGGRGRAKIEVDEMAEKMETIPYEVVARIAESVPRIYKK